ncbi:NADH:flavin oxidoreductase [Terricaulis silvestris]|uniref:NADH oxidase n=1 Tax=Terricaulis silvestris TaxID=2686094 RepID=A0A6I6MPQ7_9CAUL|nr:NADH:flavin oxidoreductase [Terricaulis silvestris]QGZ96141.1 NADH oxidase [Terricaulis silvestris]
MLTSATAAQANESPLFGAFDAGHLRLSNRVVMAPMSRYLCPDEAPHDAVVEYYRRRAAAGVGLLISEATYIPHASAHSYENVPLFYTGASLAGWKRVIDAVHGEGGRMFPQLWHTGSFRQIGMKPDPSVPGFDASENLNAFEHTTHQTKAMTESDIADVIAAYATAARSAQQIGFDGVELHGAHGYLIDSFFWSETNRRTDNWGGDIAQRTRFGVEVVKAIRQAVGANFPVSFRWSQFKQQNYRAKLANSPEELERFLHPLVDAGVSIFHASTRRYWEAGFKDLSPLTLAGWTKKITGKPTIAVGSVGLGGVASTAKTSPTHVDSTTINFADAPLDGVEKVEELLEGGEFDLIAVGRALLADPEWALKVKEGRLAERRPFAKELLRTLE